VPDTTSHHSSRRDVERNRSALLEAAADELSRNPGASMIEIAHAASLTRATLYRHFGTREKLVEGLQEEALERAAAVLALARLEEGSAIEALHRVVQGLAELGARFRPLLVEGADLDPQFRERRAAVLAPLHGVVRRGQEEGSLERDVPPEWVVAALTSMLAAGVRTIPAARAHAGQVAELVHRTLVRGIGVTGGDRGAEGAPQQN
jgi:AcrR family transcriptional regulator